MVILTDEPTGMFTAEKNLFGDALQELSKALKAIAYVLGVKFEQVFILPDGDEIKIGNEEV